MHFLPPKTFAKLFIISALIASLVTSWQSSSLSSLVLLLQTLCAQEKLNLDPLKEIQEILKFPAELQSLFSCSIMDTR